MRVLLGLGPDSSALSALDEAVERAREAGDDLTVAVFGEEADELETRARDRLAETDIDASVRHVEGDPGSQLVELASDYDRIALPGGSRSPLGKITFDDVTEFVLLNATTTVTLLR